MRRFSADTIAQDGIPTTSKWPRASTVPGEVGIGAHRHWKTRVRGATADRPTRKEGAQLNARISNSPDLRVALVVFGSCTYSHLLVFDDIAESVFLPCLRAMLEMASWTHSLRSYPPLVSP